MSDLASSLSLKNKPNGSQFTSRRSKKLFWKKAWRHVRKAANHVARHARNAARAVARHARRLAAHAARGIKKII